MAWIASISFGLVVLITTAAGAVLPAKKVAAFHEDFAVGGLDFSADGESIASNAMFAGLDVHMWELGVEGEKSRCPYIS